MEKLVLLTLVFFAAGIPPVGAAPPKLDIPKEVKADPGTWVVISPVTDAKAVTYVGLDGLAAFPSGELRDPRKMVVYVSSSAKNVRWRFVAVGTLGDEMTVVPFAVVVGDAPAPGPGPPDPGPGPGPQPDDPLSKALANAYAKDADPDRAKSLAFLQLVAEGMAAQAPKQTQIKTVADASAWVKKVVDKSADNPSGLAPGQVTNLRRVISDDLLAAFGTNPAAPITTDALAAELGKISKALAKVR